MRYSFVPWNGSIIHISASDDNDAYNKLAEKMQYSDINACKQDFTLVSCTNEDNAAPPIKADDIPEFVGQIIDIFEDFLDARDIILNNPERDEDENLDPEESANIFGTDYGELQSAIEETLNNWHVAERRS